MEHYIRSVEHRNTMKRIELIKKELHEMDNDIASYNLFLNKIDESYKKVLLKDKPVGNSIKAIRYIKNECNYCN